MYDFVFGWLYTWISNIQFVVFLIDLIIMIPLSFFRKARGFSGTVIMYSSYLFGLQLWLSGLMLTLQIWGIWAAIIGILLIGVGVVPIAMIATLFNGMWSEFIQLVLSIIIVFGSRILGKHLLEKYSYDNIQN